MYLTGENMQYFKPRLKIGEDVRKSIAVVVDVADRYGSRPTRPSTDGGLHTQMEKAETKIRRCCRSRRTIKEGGRVCLPETEPATGL